MIHHVHRSSISALPGGHRPQPARDADDQRRADPAPHPTAPPTTTSDFGVGRREAHDSSSFYARFTPPRLSDDDQVAAPAARDAIWVGDAREMDRYGEVADNSVALVVTSPPYFAGKEYEAVLGVGHVPADYHAYLGMLHDVFSQCFDKLEPGGRIAVNVANLGRKPYRSLSRDVIDLLERLGFLLRGEIVWQKSHAAGGSCAWGTYQRPGNPVLRDVSERIIVACKGRFDRAVTPDQRARDGLPSEGTMTMDEFVDATIDVWDIPAESATRVGHPAPFPVELPRRLIELYTYRGDLVLDPFVGSGSTAVAAVRTERHYIGFDTDEEYVALAERRIAEERTAVTGSASAGRPAAGSRSAPAGRASGCRHHRARRTRRSCSDGRPASWPTRPWRACGFTGHRTQRGLPGPGPDRGLPGPGRRRRPVALRAVRGLLGHPAGPAASRCAVAGAGQGRCPPRGPVAAIAQRDDLGPLVLLSTDSRRPRA